MTPAQREEIIDYIATYRAEDAVACSGLTRDRHKDYEGYMKALFRRVPEVFETLTVQPLDSLTDDELLARYLEWFPTLEPDTYETDELVLALVGARAFAA
jgi:hypothetical protein